MTLKTEIAKGPCKSCTTEGRRLVIYGSNVQVILCTACGSQWRTPYMTLAEIADARKERSPFGRTGA